MEAIKKRKKTAVTPQLDQQAAEWLEKYYPTKYKGSGTILAAFPQIFAATVAEIKGRFGESELALMIDTMNGTAITPQIMGQHIAASTADAMALDALGEKWDVNRDDLNRKLTDLTAFQKAVIEIWAIGFWQGGWNKEYKRTDEEFNRWVDLLK